LADARKQVPIYGSHALPVVVTTIRCKVQNLARQLPNGGPFPRMLCSLAADSYMFILQENSSHIGYGNDMVAKVGGGGGWPWRWWQRGDCRTSSRVC
jgi:hypothetical protein